jgi:hypothetical protein
MMLVNFASGEPTGCGSWSPPTSTAAPLPAFTGVERYDGHRAVRACLGGPLEAYTAHGGTEEVRPHSLSGSRSSSGTSLQIHHIGDALDSISRPRLIVGLPGAPEARTSAEWPEPVLLFERTHTCRAVRVNVVRLLRKIPGRATLSLAISVASSNSRARKTASPPFLHPSNQAGLSADQTLAGGVRRGT